MIDQVAIYSCAEFVSFQHLGGKYNLYFRGSYFVSVYEMYTGGSLGWECNYQNAFSNKFFTL